MKTRQVHYLALAFALGISRGGASDQSAKVTEAVNIVDYGSRQSSNTSPAHTGTLVQNGEYLETGLKSRAEMLLPTASITRLGANTIFNYSVESNTVDLQSGTILFCKPKDAAQLNIKTAAVTAGIVGTTGFTSVSTDAKTRQKTYVFGLVEGHATAHAGGRAFPVGPGEILEFKPGSPPLLLSFDVPRMVHTSIFFTGFKRRLPNQGAIDSEVASFLDDERRGFIQPPSKTVDYSGDIPILSPTAVDSAQNSQSQPKGTPPPPQPPPNNPFGR